MTHVIAEPCVGTKDTACVEVCPVDCIHEAADGTSDQLYIDPIECIDCAACVPACPVDAIFAEADLPAKWQKYTQINVDFFAAGGPAPAAEPGAAAPAKAAAAAKKAAPEPPPPPKPLELRPEDMFKDLSALRQDVADNRGRDGLGTGYHKSPALIATAACVVLFFVYAVSNNFSKSLNTTIYGKISQATIGAHKPKLMGGSYTTEREIDGKLYVINVSDSIFGKRTLSIQAPAEPILNIYHKDEKFFAASTNQFSRFYYIFVDKGSDGTLDSILQIREIWTRGSRLLGRYQKPILPTPSLQESYKKEVGILARKLGLAS